LPLATSIYLPSRLGIITGFTNIFVLCSKRAFQTQFKRWGFPSKQNPAHKNPGLVARVKELWERNTSQREMLRTLNEEGFDIKERELMRVRAKNRWLLRVPNGMKSQITFTPRVSQPMEDGLLELQQVYKHGEGHDGTRNLQFHHELEGSTSPELSPEVLAKRRERLDRLQAESAERWATRKRRRRTRGWAGLPADPPGPPRFPSETTIDESKKYLSLDNSMYRQIRDHFQKICEEAGFIKKTIAGPERWQEAKNRLIHESPHLQNVFWADPSQLDVKALALDVVCTDVTKRMRTLERRMTIAEAKNALGINPEESRQIRNAFYNTLKADHFTSKFEAGDEHWRELKEKWIRDSELLQRILAPGPADPEHVIKVKATEVLCRDVMKRLRDDQTKRDPSRKRSTSHAGIQIAGPSNASTILGNGIRSLASQALASAPIATSDAGEMQIDPSLLQATSNNATFPASIRPPSVQERGYRGPVTSTTVFSTPVYLRISPHSRVHAASRTWVEKLATRSIAELRQLVTARFPTCVVSKIEGVEKNENGNEVFFLIDEDYKLDAYLTHSRGQKALFAFCLNLKQ
jgi:hypothetical protein